MTTSDDGIALSPTSERGIERKVKEIIRRGQPKYHVKGFGTGYSPDAPGMVVVSFLIASQSEPVPVEASLLMTAKQARELSKALAKQAKRAK